MIKIDLSALYHNVMCIKKIAPASRILAVVKDNAYGHGLVPVVKRICNDVDGFGVFSLAEASVIRQLDISKPIVLMQGINQPSDLEECIKHDISSVIHHSSQLKILSSKKKGQLKIWLKFNCGLNRFGFKIMEAKSVLESVLKSRIINRKNIVIMSHLSSASTPFYLANEQEIEKFNYYTKDIPFDRSLANSAAILNYSQSHYNWIRPGLLLYGVSPFINRDGSSFGFKPVMNLEGKIISLHFCHPGDTIGYNKTWTCEKLTHVAIVNVGYADGYPYHLSSLSEVFLREQMVSIIGKVSSDAIAIDVTSIKNVHIDDPVILWGKELPVEKVAEYAGTIPYQLLCSTAQRYTRFL